MKAQQLKLRGGAQPPRPAHVRVMNEAGEHLAYLFERWGDESDYENPEDYRTSAKGELERVGAELVTMTLSPFRVTFRVVGERDMYVINLKPVRNGCAISVTGPFQSITQKQKPTTTQEKPNEQTN